MKFSEIKEQLKNSKTAETLLDTKRYFQKHKFLIYPFIIAVVILSILLKKHVIRQKQDYNTVELKKEK